MELNTNQIKIEWANCSFTSVITHDEIRRKLYDFLSINKKNYSRELIDLGIEDSKYRYYDPITQTIARGHIKYVLEFAKKNPQYELIIGDNLKLIQTHHPKYNPDFIRTLPLTIDGKKVNPFEYPYEYQGEFADWALEKRSGIGISATGSGKTLITYLIMRYLLNEQPDTKILIIVPNVTLVKQFYSDLDDFSSTDDWNVEDHLSMLHGSVKEKTKFKNVLVTTWQSIKGKRKEFYEAYNHVICDEVHGADASVLRKTLEKCINAYTKIGMTGSLKGTGKYIDPNARMTLEGLFGGRIEKFSDAAELMKRRVLPDLRILAKELRYNPRYLKEMQNLSKVPRDKRHDKHDKLKLFNEEKDYICTLESRKQYLNNFYSTLSGNVICFFNSIDNLEEAFDSYKGDKIPHKIYGQVNTKDRDDILYEQIEKTVDKEHILFATYGTLSTGISVNNLDIGVMVESMKSRVKILQSIGRMLRGNKALVIDIGDNLGKGTNFLFNHFKTRKELYDSVGYKYFEKTVEIDYVHLKRT